MIKKSQQSGFTAVELLVTLFVAALFLTAGYQLYSLIIQDGAETRAQARATNITYDYLKRYESFVTNPCTAPPNPVNNASIEVANLNDVTMTVAITCPYGASSTISKISATVTYNDGRTLTEATYYNAK